jgi:hypothetical protein
MSWSLKKAIKAVAHAAKKVWPPRVHVPDPAGRDGKHTPVVDPASVELWVEAARNVFKDRLNITVHPSDGWKGAFIHFLAAPAFVPTGPPCGFGAGFKDRADWFEAHTSDTVLGYGGTMYAFIVKTLDVKRQEGAEIGGGEDQLAVERLHPASVVAAVTLV